MNISEQLILVRTLELLEASSIVSGWRITSLKSANASQFIAEVSLINGKTTTIKEPTLKRALEQLGKAFNE